MFIVVSNIICYDILYYFFHVLLHQQAYFIHKVHHETKHSDLTVHDSHHAHYIENLATPIVVLIPTIITHASLYQLIAIYYFIYIRNALRHDHRWVWLVGNHHLLHHKYPKNNFGEYWIDCLCRTVREEYVLTYKIENI